MVATFYEFNSDDFAPVGGIDVVPTSSRSAQATPFYLREPSAITRLYFEPTLVRNPKDPESCVRGKLIYERKGKNDASFPLEQDKQAIPKDDVKKGDALVLELNSEEIRTLYLELQKRYAVYESMGGIPYGGATYVQVDNACRTLLNLLRSDPTSARMIRDADTFELVKELVKLLTQGTSHDELHDVLAGLETGNLQELSLGLRLTQLENVQDDFRRSLDNDHEEFW